MMHAWSVLGRTWKLVLGTREVDLHQGRGTRDPDAGPQERWQMRFLKEVQFGTCEHFMLEDLDRATAINSLAHYRWT